MLLGRLRHPPISPPITAHSTGPTFCSQHTELLIPHIWRVAVPVWRVGVPSCATLRASLAAALAATAQSSAAELIKPENAVYHIHLYPSDSCTWWRGTGLLVPPALHPWLPPWPLQTRFAFFSAANCSKPDNSVHHIIVWWH